MNFLKGLKAVLGLFLFVLIFLFFSKPAQAQFSTDLGAVTGSVKWGTVNIPFSWEGGPSVSLEGNTTHYQSNLGVYNGGNTGFILPPDTYTATANISLYRGMSMEPLVIPLGSQTVTVVAGETASVSFDASTVTGLVKGTLTVNGAPGSGIVQFCGPLETDPCPTNPWDYGPISANFWNEFSVPLPSGNYRAQIFSSNGILAGRVPITVTIGQITEGSSLQFSLELGAVSGSVKWGTEEISFGPEVNAVISLEGNTTHYQHTLYGYNGQFIFPPDTYTATAQITLYRGMMTDSLNVPLGNQTVSVTAGQTASVSFDASTATGLVKGNLMVNGAPSGGWFQFCGPLETDPCTTNLSESGLVSGGFGSNGFSVPLPAGDYRAQVFSPSGVFVGRVPITVTIGQITPGPSLQFSINLGAVSGSVKWGTEEISFGWEANASMSLEGNTTHYKSGVGPGSSTGFALPPDTYTVTAEIVLQRGMMVPNPIVIPLGSQTVTVIGGQTTDVNFDASTVSGLVKGSLMINGVPSGGTVQFCGPLESDPCPINVWSEDGAITIGFWNGFSVPLPAGNYRVQVTTPSGIFVGRIPITVTIGQITDLNNNSGDVSQGQNITLSLAGTEVTFSEVPVAGLMAVTTTTNPLGGMPPAQFSFLGTYYDLTTTATYSGPITVKLPYNETDVSGPEEDLRLLHWDGSAWQDITTSVDTVNNVITGVAQTLSPFAIAMKNLNSPPTVNAGGPYEVNEGGNVSLTATGTDPENKPLTYAWDLDNNGSFETAGQTATFSAAALDGPSTKTVAVEVTDEGGLKATAQATINVINVTPQVGEISLPADPQQANNLINFSASFTDAGIADTHTAVWDWGDGATSAANINETAGQGTASGSHIYSMAGVYSVKLTVADDDGASKEAISQFVVVYDPSAGFVTGGGQSTDEAKLGFSIKYLPGDSTPSGQVKFNTKDESLKFKGTGYQWLVVTSPKAVFKGTGEINGAGNYTFVISIIDGKAAGTGKDYFRMKITDNSNGSVVYDNQSGTEDTADPTVPLTKGSIVIH